ncbi:MAG TPA: polysaccharide deacetylase family protein [Syntrophobacteraceae bacterium]|nr:polysaccharide deacetylase family protein [Syntrophobacteraceae bacterium]
MATCRSVALKVDVDTHDGMRRGVPVLLEVFRRFSVRATFCLAFGPDNAGKALYRVLKDPVFFRKMLRTGAPRLYGWRTILSGTLLPARPTASGFPDLVRQIRAEKHEVIVHGWDHRLWQDHVAAMDESSIRSQFQQAFCAFEQILGVRPRAVAAPGWQATPRSLRVQDKLNLLYASDLRNAEPCFLEAGGHGFRTLQIPTTGPCVEELLAGGIREEKAILDALTAPLEAYSFPVLALHAEVEGGPFRGLLERLIPLLRNRYERFSTLEEEARKRLSDGEPIPRRELVFIRLPGRAGRIASASGPPSLVGSGRAGGGRPV